MAPVFKLTDGTTTVTLSSGNYLVTSYDMGSPTDREPDEITETVGLLFVASSYANNRTAIRAVEVLLEAAKRRQKWHAGPRVYFQVQWDGDAANWQTEVIDGHLEIPDLAEGIRKTKIVGELTITRKFFETVDWTQLSLTNTNGTDNTAGLNVYMIADGSGSSPNDRVNYFAIDAAEITGSLPCPMKVELAFGAGSVSHTWVSVNSYNSPGTFTQYIEGESAVAGGAGTANAAYSGGSARYYTASGTNEIHYTLGTALVAACAGYPFRVLAGFYGNAPNGYVTAQIRNDAGVTTLASGDRVQVDGWSTEGPLDLGVLRIPPMDYSITNGSLRLVLSIYSAASETVILDWIGLLPAYSTRYIDNITVLESGKKIVIDEANERTYVSDGTVDYAYAVAKGAPLMLEPNTATRLYVIGSRGSAVAISDYFTAKAYYKNRRWTI